MTTEAHRTNVERSELSLAKPSLAKTRLANPSLAAAALAGALSALPVAGPALADPMGGSNLGGGFIEMLMTGRNPGRPAAPRLDDYSSAPAHAPPYAAPYGAPYPAPYAAPYAAPRAPGPERPPLNQAPSNHAALNPDFRQVERSIDPVYLPQVVDYDGPQRPGTIVIDTPRRFLFLVEEGGRARRYGIGVGRPGFEWAGVKSITRKAEWPDWRPPAEMLKRRPDLPRYMAGGPDNPMGARGLYLGSSLYRIHGTNEPHTIGQAVSSGCIRMRNEDVSDLYERVRVGTKVLVI